MVEQQQQQSSSSRPSYYLFIAICSLTLSFGAAVGVNVQKMSMMKELKLKRRRVYYLQPLWMCGMVIIIIDALGDFVFVGLAPQTLLAPLGVLSLGWNIVLAPIFNPTEIVTKKVVGATGIIYVGSILTVLYAADTNPNYTLETIEQYATTRTFILYIIGCIVFQLGLAYHGGWMRRPRNNTNFGIIHYCGIGGCFGGELLIFAKSTSELAKNALLTGNYNDFTSSPLPYCFLLGMILTVLAQLHCLNTALAKYDALVVVPVYQSFINCFGTASGLLFFQEYNYMTAKDGVLYTLGIFITLCGVALLVRERKNEKKKTTTITTNTSNDNDETLGLLLSSSEDEKMV